MRPWAGSGCGRWQPQRPGVDEDRGRSIHTIRLDNSEYSVNTVHRVLAASVLERRQHERPETVGGEQRLGAEAIGFEPLGRPGWRLGERASSARERRVCLSMKNIIVITGASSGFGA